MSNRKRKQTNDDSSIKRQKVESSTVSITTPTVSVAKTNDHASHQYTFVTLMDCIDVAYPPPPCWFEYVRALVPYVLSKLIKAEKNSNKVMTMRRAGRHILSQIAKQGAFHQARLNESINIQKPLAQENLLCNFQDVEFESIGLQLFDVFQLWMTTFAVPRLGMVYEESDLETCPLQWVHIWNKNPISGRKYRLMTPTMRVERWIRNPEIENLIEIQCLPFHMSHFVQMMQVENKLTKWCVFMAFQHQLSTNDWKQWFSSLERVPFDRAFFDAIEHVDGLGHPPQYYTLATTLMPDIDSVIYALTEFDGRGISNSYVQRICELLVLHPNNERAHQLWTRYFLHVNDNERKEHLLRVWFAAHPLPEPLVLHCIPDTAQLIEEHWWRPINNFDIHSRSGRFSDREIELLYMALKYDPRPIRKCDSHIVDSARCLITSLHASLWLTIFSNVDVPNGHWLASFRERAASIERILYEWIPRELASIIVSM
jgi:hypothetical protein